MSVKSKAAPPKEKWQATRARYTWHLRPPFSNRFDHLHWWEGESKIDPVAALYELARRHPIIGELRAARYKERLHQEKHGQWGDLLFGPSILELFFMEKSEADEWRQLKHRPTRKLLPENRRGILGLWGVNTELASWPKLSSRGKEDWKKCAGKMKGVDCRSDFSRCRSITEFAGQVIQHKRRLWLWHGSGPIEFRVGEERGDQHTVQLYPEAQKTSFRALQSHLRKNPISSREWESEIARQAVRAHVEGNLIISVAPDLKLEEAKILLEQEYRKHFQNPSPVRQRARWEDWLPLIAAFENEEAKKGGKKSQAFIRYRRMMDGLQFPTKTDPSVTTNP